MVLYPAHLPKRSLVSPSRPADDAIPKPQRRSARDVLGAMYARIDEDLDDLSE